MSWYSAREKGSELGMRLTLLIMRVVGYRISRLVVAVIALYYTLFSPAARRCLAAFQRRAMGRSGFGLCYRTIRGFSEGMMDRAYMLMGRRDFLEFEPHVSPCFEQLVDEGRGGILLGSHLGALEVCRLSSGGQRYPITPLIQTGISPMFYRVLKRIDPQVEERMLLVETGAMELALLARDRVEQGEVVAILADRVNIGGPSTRIPFLGDETSFPLGPHAIASALGCPVFTIFVAKIGPRRYELHIEEFAHGEAPSTRSERRARIESLARRFVERLEHYCRRFPTQWYNFHDFWGEFRPGDRKDRP